MGADALKIVYRDPAKLKPHPRNARTHSDAQVKQVRASIERFGFTVPVLLRDDNATIGAGHARQLAALLEPPIGRIPTVTLHGLSDAEWRAYMLADNKLALNSGWDLDMLRTELGDLRTIGFDLSFTGFDGLELRGLLRQPGAARDPDAVPAVPRKVVTRPGDRWACGEHVVLCGDSTLTTSVAQALGDQVAALCLTDPPYGIGFAYGEHDDSDSLANAALVAAVFQHAPAARVWTPGLMNLSRDITRFGAARVLCWHKGFAAAGNGLGGASTWEPVLVVAPAVKKLANDYLDFKTDREQLGGKSLHDYHPCPKPVALFAHLAEAFSARGALIYEPFGGSGTTLMACETAERRCASVEIDPAYCDVAVMRWQEFTGQDAVNQDGQTFAEAKQARAAPAARRRPKG